MASLSARALSGIPEVRAGDDLAGLIVAALDGARPAGALRDGQIVAIAHKVVSKAEGSVVEFTDVHPSPRARELAAAQSKDPRAVQVVLDQSAEIVRAERGVLICRTHHGFLCANAGVDASNAAGEAGAKAEPEAEALVLLPRDPDASARGLRARLRELTGASVAVLITDSFGRAWRHGQSTWRSARRHAAAGRLARAHRLGRPGAAGDLAGRRRRRRRDRRPGSREGLARAGRLIDGLERFVTAQDGPGAAALLRALEEDLFR